MENMPTWYSVAATSEMCFLCC